MKAHNVEMILVLLAVTAFTSSGLAQTNRAPVPPAELRIVAIHPAMTAVRTNVSSNRATAEFKLPPGSSLKNYRVLEHQAGTTREASNVVAKSTNEVSAELTLGNTLMFVEKEPRPSAHPVSPAGGRQLFSTYFVKAVAPAQSGQPLRAVSGSLAMFADVVPTLWNVASNAYVARLTVMFSTEDAAPDSPLLPLAVNLSGENIRSIEPRQIEIQKPNVAGGEEVVIICDRYATNTQITAHYLTTSSSVPLELKKLTWWDLVLMVMSIPLLFAALTGGFLGGLSRWWKSTKPKWLRILRYLAEGVTIGLVTVAMLRAGLLATQITGLPEASQLVLAFALAWAAGSVGAHFLDKTVNQLRGK